MPKIGENFLFRVTVLIVYFNMYNTYPWCTCHSWPLALQWIPYRYPELVSGARCQAWERIPSVWPSAAAFLGVTALSAPPGRMTLSSQRSWRTSVVCRHACSNPLPQSPAPVGHTQGRPIPLLQSNQADDKMHSSSLPSFKHNVRI